MTGGSFPAQTWQAVMEIAHRSMDIPTIPGLDPHPRQIEERQRLAELRKSDPTLAAARSGQTSETMSPQARDALILLLKNLERAREGQAPVPPSAQSSAATPDKRARRPLHGSETEGSRG